MADYDVNAQLLQKNINFLVEKLVEHKLVEVSSG